MFARGFGYFKSFSYLYTCINKAQHMNTTADDFNLVSKFNPTKDQQLVIDGLLEGLNDDNGKFQTLKGITGSGKTFVLSNVIAKSNKPSLVLAPNKILAFQLYKELLEFFPDNFVGYYVSNYDQYLPAYFSDSLNQKVDGYVVVNAANKALRYTVKDFLEQSQKAILVCSSTILFPTFRENLHGLIEKNKSYIIRRLNEEKIKQCLVLSKQGCEIESNRLESIIDNTIDKLISTPEYYNNNILSILGELYEDFYLTDYFNEIKPNLFIDESHLTLLQLKCLPTANYSRLQKLVNKGYYLNNILNTKILNSDMLFKATDNIVFVSATPSNFEIEKSEKIHELLTRPNNLVDPEIISKPKDYFNSNKMVEHIKNNISKGESTFINCLSRKYVSKVCDLLKSNSIESTSLHFKIKQDERKQILTDLREGNISVIVGINMLREGLDVKSCSLVIIEDASRNNFLRTKSCLIQIAGRASRNKNGKVFMCFDKPSLPVTEAIEEIHYRRTIQLDKIKNI